MMPAKQVTPPTGPTATASGNVTAKSYTLLQQFIRSESGIVIEDDKQYLLETRLSPVMKLHQLANLDALATAVSARRSPDLARSVIDAMTTNETLFFRDGAFFEALNSAVIPEIFTRVRGTRPVRIWSAAASSGQEAYSLALSLLEMGKNKSDVEIVGTDLSSHVLERARRGRYGQFEVNRGLPTPLMTKYFTKVGLEWEINDSARSMVHFKQLDLRQDLRSLGSFDLVLCRNVLIYFDTATKAKILDGIRGQMSPGGLLALGCAETIINVHAGFQRQTVAQSAFYGRL
jgi:chemotaxis protein methyltransferase CheR